MCSIVTFFCPHTRCFHRRILAALLMVLLPAQYSVADAYMDALQEEATELEYLDETRPGNTVSTRANKLNPALKKALTNISSFEKYFRKEDSATAAIYFRLTIQERLRIYRRFQSTKNFKIARNMVIEMFNKK